MNNLYIGKRDGDARIYTLSLKTLEAALGEVAPARAPALLSLALTGKTVRVRNWTFKPAQTQLQTQLQT